MEAQVKKHSEIQVKHMWWARVWKLNLAKLPASAVKRWKKCESPKSPTHWRGYFGNSLALSYDIKPPPQLVTSTLDTCVHIQKKRAHSFWCVQVPTTSVLVIKTRSHPTTYQQGTLELRHVQTEQKQRSDALRIGEVLNSLVRGGLWMAQSLELEENVRCQAVDLQVFV